MLDYKDSVLKIFSSLESNICDDLNLDSPLMSYNDWDSFKHIDFLMKIENEFGIEFKPEEYITTLQDAIQLVKEKCSSKN